MIRDVRAILFDFNGVLVDDEPIHLEMFQRVLEEEGIAMSVEDYFGSFLGLDDRGCFSAVLQAAGEAVTAPRLMRLIARKASYYQERIRRAGYPFFAGAVELVREAAGAGLMLGVVSGALREEIGGALAQAGVLDSFKVVVAAEDVAEGKPDPEGYRRALEGLNSLPPLPERLLHPHEVLAIEDSVAGLAAAADAGLATLAVAHTYPAERLRAANAVAESLRGMTLVELEGLFAGGREPHRRFS
jgi:beta-phosphoglucomutase